MVQNESEHWVPPTILVTPKNDLSTELFEPALAMSLEYKRAVGFFSSSWIERNAKGISTVAARGGSVKWITSPHLSKPDWTALTSSFGDSGSMLERMLCRSVDEWERAISADALNAIAWMVHDKILEFRIAVAAHDWNHENDFHTKFGVFADESGPWAAFVGSLNESAHSLQNHEVISVFARGRTGEDARIQEFDDLFDDIWEGRDPYYVVYDLPAAARARVVKLRKSPRPYSAQPGTPTLGEFQLRPYQEEALAKWKANSFSGILEMATGTGKTITAIAGIESLLSAPAPPSLVLVVCPFQHLVDQWSSQLSALGINVVEAHEASATWRPKLHAALQEVDVGEASTVIVVTTYKTATSDFLLVPIANHVASAVIIADECHYLGSSQASKLMEQPFRYRMGLSATPERYYDDVGTAAIRDFFQGVVFRFGMELAICEGYLVPYRYYPEVVELSGDEADDYLSLSAQISRFGWIADEGLADGPLKTLLMKRARVLNNAKSKLDWLESQLRARDLRLLDFALVYAGDELFTDVTRLLGKELQLRIHEFTSRQSRSQRLSLLERFESQDLQVLAAMKCLDEGVDVPPTRTAFFLASSGNPREYVQRRGRILRRSPGKFFADIYDAVAVPPVDFMYSRRGSSEWKAGRAALRSQLGRVREFARLAQNRVQAEDVLFEVRAAFDIPDDFESEDAGTEMHADG